MARSPRLLLSQSYYHIITRGNNRMTVFSSDSDYRYYLELIARFKKELPFALYHYCLMPNHIHLLVRTQKAENFSMFMKKINLAYFYHFKNLNNWVGHLWQDRFKSQPVGKDEYFIQCGKYIELNPVRAGIVKNPEDYLYSSYNFYAQGKPNILLTEDIFYGDLGDSSKERRKKYADLVINEVVTNSYNKNIWGSPRQRYNEKRKINYHLKI
jgi:putative transposase